VLVPDVNYSGWTLMLIGGVLFTLRLPGSGSVTKIRI
jgi:hypothetical protein